MLQSFSMWATLSGLFLWLILGSWRIGAHVSARSWFLALRELGVVAFHLLVGVLCFLIVIHFVPETIHDPNGVQTFLLLLVPLVLLGRLIRRYVWLPIPRWRART